MSFRRSGILNAGLLYSLLCCIFVWQAVSCGNREQDGGSVKKPFDASITNEHQLDSIMVLLEKNPLDYRMNRLVLDYYSVTSRSDELNSYALSLFRRAIAAGDTSLAVLPASTLAYQYLEANNPDSSRYFIDFVKANAGEDDHVYRIIHNVEAIYALRFRMDYPKAMYHYQEALRYSREYGYTTSEVVLLSNIAYIYYYRNDTNGLKYSREAYRKASYLSNPYALCMSSIAMSVMEYVSGNYENSVKYADKALSIVGDNSGFSVFLPEIFCTRANSYSRLGVDIKAEEDYQRAFSALRYNGENSVRVKLLLSYADFLFSLGKYEESLEYYREGIDLSEKSFTVDYSDRLYLGLSKAYARLGRNDSAYRYGLKYHAVSDSLYSLTKENEMNQLFLDYQNLVHKSDMQQKELELLKSRRVSGYALLTAAALALIFIITYINYRRKDAMYTLLVERYQKFMEKEDNLKTMAEEKPDAKSNSEAELFGRLERLMTEEKVYLDKNLSMDKLCELLSTNRSYLSSAINRYAKMTLPNYINSYRIREAISIISDPEKDVLLKSVYDEVGYNSKTSFYRAFQKETGCSPLVYREKALQLLEKKVRN